MNIDDILCRKETCKDSQGFTLSLGGQTYRLSKDDQAVPSSNKAVISVLTSHRFGIRAEYKDGVYQIRKTIRPAKVIAKENRVKRPILTSPFTRDFKLSVERLVSNFSFILHGGGSPLSLLSTRPDHRLQAASNARLALPILYCTQSDWSPELLQVYPPIVPLKRCRDH